MRGFRAGGVLVQAVDPPLTLKKKQKKNPTKQHQQERRGQQDQQGQVSLRWRLGSSPGKLRKVQT